MSKENKAKIINKVKKLIDGGKSQRSACKTAGVPESTYRTWRDSGKYEKPVVGVCDDPKVSEGVSIAEDLDEGLEEDCLSTDEHIAQLAKRLRTAQKTNSQLRKVNNGAMDQTGHFKEMIKAVENASSRVSLGSRGKVIGILKPSSAVSATAEILFSDFQIGKVGQYYNSELAKKAIQKYGARVMEEMDSTDYVFERIILAAIGDIVEDHLKHGVQSATSTDSGLAEQMAKALEYLWEFVISPLGSLGIPMEVICIAGNHGSSEHKGMDMYKAGLYSYDYPIYKALEGYCKAAGWGHVRFIIPEGVFAYTEIYGRTAVYEHGYFNSCTEKSLCDQKAKRSQQIKRHVEYFRCGDMHHVCDYNNGQEVVNGAFFGVDFEGVEYSGILGFNSIPAQKMMVHTREDSIGRNTIKRNINIQVADGY